MTSLGEEQSWPEPGDGSRPRRTDTATVEAGVRRELVRRRAVLEDVDPGLGAVVDAVEALAIGGKRLRARFALLGASGASGGAEVEGAQGLATAVELFHLAALVHDDLMDHADERRGVPTVQRAFDTASADFAGSVAVLAGDLLLTWADDVLARSTQQLPTGAAVRRVWSQMRDQVLAGQYLDLWNQERGEVDTHAVVRTLVYKSAKYTVEHPLRLGGVLAGAPDSLLAGYSTYGLAVGEAFQLRDDLLDLFGDAELTGKAIGGDLREGKQTLLVAHAVEAATPAQQEVLATHLGDPDLDEAGVDAVREVVVATGARDRVEARIADLAGRARSTATALAVDEVTRAELLALADGAAWRRR